MDVPMEDLAELSRALMNRARRAARDKQGDVGDQLSKGYRDASLLVRAPRKRGSKSQGGWIDKAPDELQRLDRIRRDATARLTGFVETPRNQERMGRLGEPTDEPKRLYFPDRDPDESRGGRGSYRRKIDQGPDGPVSDNEPENEEQDKDDADKLKKLVANTRKARQAEIKRTSEEQQNIAQSIRNLAGGSRPLPPVERKGGLDKKIIRAFNKIEDQGRKARGREENKRNKNTNNLDEPLDDPSKHCLLYTSPSPRDRQKSRMPSSA